MTRLLALALAVTATATAAPIPEAALPPPLYAATRVGAKRVMGKGNFVGWKYTVTAADPQPDGSVRVYEQREYEGEAFPLQEVLSVSPKGVFFLGYARSETGKDIREAEVASPWREPQCRVRHAGKWEWHAVDPDKLVLPNGVARKQRTTVYETVGVEKVVVPAGTFRAMRVESSVRGEDNRQTTWYAPGVGAVQTAVRGGVSQQLLSFEPGPAPAKAP